MKIRSLLGAVAAVSVLASVSTVQAAPTLRFSLDGVNVAVECADGQACDSNALPGVVTYVGSIGTFLINVTTGLGNDASSVNLMDLNSVNVSTAAGTLYILFSDVGYAPSGMLNLQWGGTLSGSTGSTVEAALWASGTNALFAENVFVAGIGPFGLGAFAGTASGMSPLVSPYSLTQIIRITQNGAGNYSGDFEVTVPEPGTLALLGLGLAGLGLARRRRV